MSDQDRTPEQPIDPDQIADLATLFFVLAIGLLIVACLLVTTGWKAAVAGLGLLLIGAIAREAMADVTKWKAR